MQDASAIAERTWTAKAVHGLAIVLLGIVVPVVVLAQAYQGLAKVSAAVGQSAPSQTPAAAMMEVKSALTSANDYALFALLSAEHANKAIVTNKQIMKIAIMQIGFAVISLGLMLLILGINEGGGQGVAGIMDLKFDFRTGSTGVVVFVVGAAMATAGGVLKNEYATVPLPGFTSPGSANDITARSFLNECKASAGKDYAVCFANTFEYYLAEER